MDVCARFFLSSFFWAASKQCESILNGCGNNGWKGKIGSLSMKPIEKESKDSKLTLVKWIRWNTNKDTFFYLFNSNVCDGVNNCACVFGLRIESQKNSSLQQFHRWRLKITDKTKKWLFWSEHCAGRWTVFSREFWMFDVWSIVADNINMTNDSIETNALLRFHGSFSAIISLQFGWLHWILD